MPREVESGRSAQGEASPPAALVPIPASAVAPSPRSAESLSLSERERLSAALAEGRRLHHRHDYEGAMAAFSRALDVLPGDPQTLSELGWAALFALRLDEAEAALREAEVWMGDHDDDRLRASILYNQGRVAEARGQTAAAIDAYQRSLRLRAHPATYRHLTSLEGGTRYVFGPTVRRLQGPYARLSELCAEERRLSRR